MPESRSSEDKKFRGSVYKREIEKSRMSDRGNKIPEKRESLSEARTKMIQQT